MGGCHRPWRIVHMRPYVDVLTNKIYNYGRETHWFLCMYKHKGTIKKMKRDFVINNYIKKHII